MSAFAVELRRLGEPPSRNKIWPMVAMGYLLPVNKGGELQLHSRLPFKNRHSVILFLKK